MQGRVEAIGVDLFTASYASKRAWTAPVAHAVGRELEAGLDRRPDHGLEPVGGNEQDPAVFRVVDRVGSAHSPRAFACRHYP